MPRDVPGIIATAIQDYAEIQQLYIAYAWAIDTKADNGMVYARTFTTDGEFYNAAVNINNVRMEQFPELLLSTAAGLVRRTLFESPPATPTDA